MLRYMLDTDICIHVIKNHPLTLLQRFNRFAEQLCMSSISVAELVYGAEKSASRAKNLHAIEHFCARLKVLAFTSQAAAHFGQMRADVERLGTPVGAFDLLIGAHARAERMIVVTNNAREFGRLPGIEVENWIGQ
jgi:tRNA(fMet)-specific endonuclease VapC